MQDPLHLSLPEFPVSLLGDGGVRASSGPPRELATSFHSRVPFTTNWGPDGSLGSEGVCYEFVTEPRLCGGVH